MESDEFLSKNAFEALPESEQVRYIERLAALVEQARKERDYTRGMKYAQHFTDLVGPLEPFLSAEERERLSLTLWETTWENAERVLDLLNAGIASGELSPTETASAEAFRENIRAVVEHKRGLNDV